MLARINVLQIIKDHFKTLRSLNKTSDDRIYWKDVLIFIIFPAIVAVSLAINDYTYEFQVGNLITTISIIGGFLFNLLAIIYGQMQNIKSGIDTGSKNNGDLLQLKERFVKEIHINISFSIVLSIFCLTGLLLSDIMSIGFKYQNIFNKIWIGFNYYLITLLILTILMVLNRVYILLKRE